MKKLTTQEFIDRARAVHGDKYGYAFSVYINTNTIVFIYCKKHGMFEIKPSKHLSGRGCQKCSDRKLTTEKFIKNAVNVHGNKYDYSKTEFVNSHKKVIITCKLHGEFYTTPNSHTNGTGCPNCHAENRGDIRRSSSDEFIEKSRSIHGDKYDYNSVVYNTATNKVVIGCRKHGEFRQAPLNHLQGKGCQKCKRETLSKQKTKDENEVIASFVSRHGNRYDYSLVNYISTHKKVKIVCHEHGVFEQAPANHSKGVGCPSCAKYGFDRNDDGYVYLLRSECGRYVKIGISHKPKQRHKLLKRLTPFLFQVIECIKGQGSLVAETEKILLRSTTPVTFDIPFDGSTEWRLWDESIRHRLLAHMKQER